jgi:hypothetical protein
LRCVHWNGWTPFINAPLFGDDCDLAILPSIGLDVTHARAIGKRDHLGPCAVGDLDRHLQEVSINVQQDTIGFWLLAAAALDRYGGNTIHIRLAVGDTSRINRR